MFKFLNTVFIVGKNNFLRAFKNIMISFSKIKAGICHCASTVKSKFSSMHKFNFTSDFDSFDKRSYAYKVLQNSNNGYNAYLCRDTLKDINEFNISNYIRLSHEQVHAIRGMVSFDTAENAQIVVNNSKIIKQFFDNKYGEHNYVFVAADETYSPVAKCLEYLGVKSATKPTEDLAYESGKVIFCLGRDSMHKIKTLKKRFRAKNHVFIDLNETLLNNRDIKNNPKLRTTINDLNQRKILFRYNGYGDEKPLSEQQKKFQFCLLDILNS